MRRRKQPKRAKTSTPTYNHRGHRALAAPNRIAVADFQTITYWPPEGGKAHHLQGQWLVAENRVLLDREVAEGGFLYNGVCHETFPIEGSAKIQHFSRVANLRDLRMLRVAEVS
jgi:hypothetical protein